MSNIDKQALRSTSERDWFEDWFKREFHPDKTGPYIKDQLFFAVRAARAPLLDELEAAEKRIAELTGQKRVIGWRMADYTDETADPALAKNWASAVDVLPIFEGDVNTKLSAAAAGKGE
ncbi:hypothetical protein ABKV83_11675 [Enterobacter asburiae]|uniref:hypothetical protein n=1 Tax=Enterobacter asburiae TaxID=61645 RepID=UPI0032AFE086